MAKIARGVPIARWTNVECDADNLVAQGLIHPFPVLTGHQTLHISLVILVGMGTCTEKTSDCGRNLVDTKGRWKKLLVASPPKGILLGCIVGTVPCPNKHLHLNNHHYPENFYHPQSHCSLRNCCLLSDYQTPLYQSRHLSSASSVQA